MRIGRKNRTLESPFGPVVIKRDTNGIPEITADALPAMYYGLGFMHAHDRILNMELNRLIAQGRGAECLDPSLLTLDRTMRRDRLYGDAKEEAKKLKGKDLELVEAYCRGVNRRFFKEPLPLEFKLIHHKPEPWTPADVIATLKLIGIVDLTETQGWMEKFIMEMLKQGYEPDRIRELFPYLTDQVSQEYREILKQIHLPEPMVPETIAWKALNRMSCSNNWVLKGFKTESGKPLLCGDPHLDSSRLPAIWQEVILQCGEFRLAGATIPGIPGFPLGRTDHLAWSPTYGNMDVVDYFVEDVRGLTYRRGDAFIPFQIREEVIQVKGETPVTVRYFETVHGVLESEPNEDGYFLCLAWSAARQCGAESVVGMLRAPYLHTMEEALDCYKDLDFSAFNWVVADSEDHIGYCMSGRNPVRREGSSGLIPLPGWDPDYDWKGYYHRSMNPTIRDPKEGYIVTANQDLNEYGQAQVINMVMAPYRTRRIMELLEARNDHSVESMKNMHYDVYSKQAEDYMRVIRPLLPDTETGKLLAEWDLTYRSDSVAPTLFERIYTELIALVFGELNFGAEVLDFLVHETVLMHDYYYNFDQVLLKESSAWFDGQSRDVLFQEAIARAFKSPLKPYGESRKIMMNHILLGGRLPRFLGFDYGPVELIGGRCTISISQIFKTAGRTSTFSPTYRFITDFNEQKIHSALAGGPSDRRFSKYYTSGIRGWMNGVYNELLLPREAGKGSKKG